MKEIVIMGHVLDTEHVRALEQKYHCKLIGYSAAWTRHTVIKNGEEKTTYRVEVEDSVIGQWRGVYPMNAEDLEIY
jgi:hypothetical protein